VGQRPTRWRLKASWTKKGGGGAPSGALPRRSVVAAGGSPTKRRTESLLGNSRTEGHLLGPSVRGQTPHETPFCSAPLVCLVCRFLHCQELAREAVLIVMIRGFLKPKTVFGFKESMWPSSSWTAVRRSATSWLGNVEYDLASPVLICSSLEEGWCNGSEQTLQRRPPVIFAKRGATWRKRVALLRRWGRNAPASTSPTPFRLHFAQIK